MFNFQLGVVVAIPKLPVKKELAVVVAIKLPTVSCVPVAIRAEPSELDVIMELLAKYVEPVPPFAMVLEKEPPPTHVPAMEKQPDLTLTPPVDEKLVVAGSKLTTLLMAKREPGEVEEMPR